MKYRYEFNKMGKVSLIGFGAWQLGNKSNWDGPDFDEGIALVKKAYENGINFFDTAPNYGDGNSELILGEALKSVRKNVFINTKIGHGPDGAYEFTEEGIKKSIERSLHKLQTNYLDSVILHNPERYILEGKTSLFRKLEEYKKEGVIHKYGVSIDTLEEAKIVLDNLNVDTIEIMFNIIHQEPKYIFQKIKEKNIFLIIKVPLDSGWLTGKYDEHSIFTGIRERWTQEAIKTRAEIISRIKKILNTEELTAPALKFISEFEAVSTIIPGMRTQEQLLLNASSLDYPLSNTEMNALQAFYDEFIKYANVPW